MGQVGIDFLTRVAFAELITAVDTGSGTFTFDDENHVIGSFLTDGDTLTVGGSTGNDGTYTIATTGVDTGTTDETTVTVDEAVSDSTADGTIKYIKPVGGATNASFEKATALVSVTNKDSGRYEENLATTKTATISFDAGFLESGQQTGQGMTVEVSTDGGSSYDPIAEVTSVDLSLNMDTVDDTDADSNRWRELLPGTRSADMSIEAQYTDPANHDALSSIRTQEESGSIITVKLTLASFEYEADFFVSSTGESQPVNDAVPESISLTQSDTAPSISYDSQDDGLRVWLAAFFADPSIPIEVEEQVRDAAGNLESGATYRSGDFYTESLSVSIPFDGEATVSGTLQNTGAITEATQD